MAVNHDVFISYSHTMDVRLGPALERGLEKIAKPLLRLRGMDAFIDQTSLTASPGLWSSILEHLRGSAWFILIASPASAASQWCNKEVAWWLDNRSSDRLLIVLTDGDIVWDPDIRDFDWARTSALSEDLRQRVPEEPLFVDLRWAIEAEDLSLRNPRFRESVVSLAAPIRGMRRDELDSADIRQLRRNRRFVQIGVLLITIAAGVAVWQAIVAKQQRQEAIQQRNTAMARYLAIQAAAVKTGDLAILLAIESLNRRTFVETEVLLRNLIRRRPAVKGAALNSGGGSPSNFYVWQFSPGGTYFVSGGLGQKAVLWNIDPLRRLHEWPMGQPVTHATFSSDEKQLAVAAGDTVVTVSLPDGQPQQVVNGMGVVSSLDFSSNGSQLAVGLWTNYGIGGPRNGHVVVDVARAQHVAEEVTERAVERVSFSPDGRYLATGDRGGNLLLWSAKDGFSSAAKRYLYSAYWDFDPTSGSVVTLGPDKQLLVHAVGGTTTALPAWDINDLKAFAIAPDGQTLAVIRNQSVEFYDRSGTRKHQVLLTDGKPRNIRFLDPTLLEVRWQELVAVYDATTGEILADIDRQKATASPDGSLLATAELREGGAWLQLWHVGGGDPVMRVMHEKPVCTVAFDSGGSRLLTGSEDGTALVRKIPEGENLISVQHPGPVTGVWLSPDGTEAVSAGAGVALWSQTSSGRVLKRIEYRPEQVGYWHLVGACRRDARKLAVSFTRSAPMLAVATLNEEVDVYDFASQAKIMTVQHRMDEDPLSHRGDSLFIAFAPDGNRLSTYNTNKVRPVRTWDIASGQEMKSDSPDATTASRLSINPWPIPLGQAGRYQADRVDDGIVIRQGGSDTIVKKLLHDRRVDHVTMSPDGRYIATASENGQASLFLFNVEDLIEAACQRVGANMTHEQWYQYVGLGDKQKTCASRPER